MTTRSVANLRRCLTSMPQKTFNLHFGTKFFQFFNKKFNRFSFVIASKQKN